MERQISGCDWKKKLSHLLVPESQTCEKNKTKQKKPLVGWSKKGYGQAPLKSQWIKNNCMGYFGTNMRLAQGTKQPRYHAIYDASQLKEVQ